MKLLIESWKKYLKEVNKFSLLEVVSPEDLQAMRDAAKLDGPQFKIVHRKMVRKYHPDLGGDTEDMQIINALKAELVKGQQPPAPQQSPQQAAQPTAQAQPLDEKVWYSFLYRKFGEESTSDMPEGMCFSDNCPATGLPPGWIQIHSNRKNQFIELLEERGLQKLIDKIQKSGRLFQNDIAVVQRHLRGMKRKGKF